MRLVKITSALCANVHRKFDLRLEEKIGDVFFDPLEEEEDAPVVVELGDAGDMMGGEELISMGESGSFWTPEEAERIRVAQEGGLASVAQDFGHGNLSINQRMKWMSG